ncbi:hypothetical protein Veis_4488 [Verminephrobacter eiseniae EF01-2]|uniref:Uncharacterized protein n=1 Tax=Verminephrobacter eiseniae (strain EF01-2) TaxID=391735 RepID=A1WRD2_VEREI|nr:hypothetical protein Veis_4488 [Verminephrobacter eiseniae EF01-2]
MADAGEPVPAFKDRLVCDDAAGELRDGARWSAPLFTAAARCTDGHVSPAAAGHPCTQARWNRQCTGKARTARAPTWRTAAATSKCC